MNESQRMELAACIMRASAQVFARSVRVLAQIEGMKAENIQREMRGESLAYPDKAFFDLIEQEGLDHNAVIATLSVG